MSSGRKSYRPRFAQRTTNYSRRRKGTVDNYPLMMSLLEESERTPPVTKPHAPIITRTSSPLADQSCSEEPPSHLDFSRIGHDRQSVNQLDEEIFSFSVPVSLDSSDEEVACSETDEPSPNLWSFAGRCSTLTASEAAMLLVSLQRTFRITDSAMDAIVKLIVACLKPASDIAFHNFRSVKRAVINSMVDKVGHITSPVKKVCQVCFSEMSSKECQNVQCSKYKLRQQPAEYFTCSIENQVCFAMILLGLFQRLHLHSANSYFLAA